MNQEYPIAAQVHAAKNDLQQQESLISTYMPFIRRETARFLGRICSAQDDELSVAMMAFHESILHYSRQRGAFFSYAALTIKSRLIDYTRRQKRHSGVISLDAPAEEGETSVIENMRDPHDPYDQSVALTATKQEIAELSKVLTAFGVSLSDIADNCPKQARTKQLCADAVRCAIENPDILQTLLSTKKIPMAQLVQASSVPRKTLERHRKYLLAMLLIQTNGYHIIRGHIARVLPIKGGAKT